MNVSSCTAVRKLFALSIFLASALASAADGPKPDAAKALDLMERAAHWQLAHLEPIDSIKAMREETRSPRSWQQVLFK